MEYPLFEVIYTWLIPGVRRRTGMLRFKFLGIDFCLYWPTADWGWGFHVLMWGYGADLDLRSRESLFRLASGASVSLGRAPGREAKLKIDKAIEVLNDILTFVPLLPFRKSNITGIK